MKKLYFVMAAVLVASMLLTACGGGGGAATAPDCTKSDVFCAGLVTDTGKVDDKSFNQGCWEGLQAAKTAGDADWIQYVETTDSKDYDKNIAIFTDAGYDVIVTCGFNLTNQTYEAAKKNPNISFIGVDQFLLQDDAHPDLPLANLTGLVYNEDQSGFLVGALGAWVSKSHKLGGVAGTDLVPPVWRYGEGYKAGAAYADQMSGTTTEVTVVYHSDVGFDKTFDDPEWGATTANSMMDKGVDVIFGIGGKTGNGGVIAAAQRGLYGIGVDADQYFTMTEAQSRLLSSAMKPLPPPIAELIKAAKAGSFPGGLFFGPAGYAPFHDLDGEVSAEIKAQMEELLAGILDGSIKTNVPPVKPAE
ncbi:MAG TPA: BMP family ABC transporter substrate-binding protein [Anaerolineales bacterium]|nr:BMP family ABC transporter substrate-binding protein [Anaerolineales bacterium]